MGALISLPALCCGSAQLLFGAGSKQGLSEYWMREWMNPLVNLGGASDQKFLAWSLEFAKR